MSHIGVRTADVSFSQWYASAAGPLQTTLYVVTRDAELAEEATAEAFARAYANWSKVRDMESPSGWVYTVALNLLRRWQTRRAMEQRYLSRIEQPREAFVPPELDDEIWSAVRELPVRARTAIGLRYIADLSEAEIARVMGISRGTVAATLSKARSRLAIGLAPSYEGCVAR